MQPEKLAKNKIEGQDSFHLREALKKAIYADTANKQLVSKGEGCLKLCLQRHAVSHNLDTVAHVEDMSILIGAITKAKAVEVDKGKSGTVQELFT